MRVFEVEEIAVSPETKFGKELVRLNDDVIAYGVISGLFAGMLTGIAYVALYMPPHVMVAAFLLWVIGSCLMGGLIGRNIRHKRINAAPFGKESLALWKDIGAFNNDLRAVLKGCAAAGTSEGSMVEAMFQRRCAIRKQMLAFEDGLPEDAPEHGQMERNTARRGTWDHE